MIGLSRFVLFLAIFISIPQTVFSAGVREAKQVFSYDGLADQLTPENVPSICDCPPRTKPHPFINPGRIFASSIPLALKVSDSPEQKTALDSKVIHSASAVSKKPETSYRHTHQKFAIYFELGRGNIGEGEREQLDEILKLLPADHMIHVEGYTCKLGEQAINDKIASARAHAVKNYLSSKGIVVNRFEGRGKHGYVSNANQLNRRVEIEIKSREK